MLEAVCEKIIVFKDGQLKRLEHDFKQVVEQEHLINKKNVSDKRSADEKLLIENELTRILGQLQNYTPEDKEYKRLDEEFNSLIKKKNELR